jgi:hypothetical protein
MTDHKTSDDTVEIAGRTMKVRQPKPPYYCSFCGKADHEVRKMIDGPTVFICDECVGLCVSILCDQIPDYLPSIIADINVEKPRG